MGKLNLSIVRCFSLLCSLILSSCSPVIREREKVIMTKDLISKFWSSENTDNTGDTLVLSRQNARLVSRFKVKNFTITADLYTTDGAEGKLDIHAASSADARIKGYSVKINNTDYRNGDPQKTGSLSLIRNNFVKMVPDEKWFSLKVEVRANNIKVMINDKMISEYVQPKKPIRIAGLEGMVLSEGLVVLQKTSEQGTIVVGEISVEAYDNDLSDVTDSVAVNDSIAEMLTLLNQQAFPVIDYHSHLKGGLMVDQVTEHGRMLGYNFGIAPNCGLNFPVTNDSSLLAYYNEMRSEPVFKAMQCEGREWVTLFSPTAIARFDYIFTDAMTWTDHKGRRLRLWIPEETFIDDEQQFMDMLVDKIEAEMSQEPVDIYVNPTYLPEVIAGKYDQLWTPERMDRVIKVLVENDVALEINSRFKIPSIAFVKKAKAAGVKFTLGTNNAGSTDLGRLQYSLHVIREAGITPGEIFIPRATGDKKVMKKGLPAKITG